MMLVHARAARRQGNHSEPNRFRAESFRTYSGLVIASLLGAIARAALDYEPFLQGSKRIVASPGRLKDSHENFLFGMWIKGADSTGSRDPAPFK